MNTFPKNTSSNPSDDLLKQESLSLTEEGIKEIPISLPKGTIDELSKPRTRKSKYFHPIIMVFLMLLIASQLMAQVSGTVEVGAVYTDNAFQLSDYDLERNENNHADLKFVDSADDVVLNTKLTGFYKTHWRWWQIQPSLQINAYQHILNTDKQRFEALAGIKVSRKYGELGLSYGYYPENYIRYYKDTDGSGEQEKYSYEKNLYRAELKVKPLSKTTLSLDYILRIISITSTLPSLMVTLQPGLWDYNNLFPHFIWMPLMALENIKQRRVKNLTIQKTLPMKAISIALAS
jgi:hypothetical protein